MESDIPELPWRPPTIALGFGVSTSVLVLIAGIPWWEDHLFLIAGIAVAALLLSALLGIAFGRTAILWRAYSDLRGVPAEDVESALHIQFVRHMVLDPEPLILIPLILLIETALIAKPAEWLDALPGVALIVAFVVVMTLVRWRFSPWFRLRWHLMRATWCRTPFRALHLQRALDQDPDLTR